MTRIRVSGLLALDSLLLTFLSAPELFLTLGHAHFDQAHFGPTTPKPSDLSEVASVDPWVAARTARHYPARPAHLPRPDDRAKLRRPEAPTAMMRTQEPSDDQKAGPPSASAPR